MSVEARETCATDPLGRVLAAHTAKVPVGYEARLGEAGICSSCGREIRLRHVGDDLCLWTADGEPADKESRCNARGPARLAEFRPPRHYARNRLESYHYSAVVRP